MKIFKIPKIIKNKNGIYSNFYQSFLVTNTIMNNKNIFVPLPLGNGIEIHLKILKRKFSKSQKSLKIVIELIQTFANYSLFQ